MAKLYFKYGSMGSSKTANALMTRFNYIEKGKTVWLIKPATDTRDDRINKFGRKETVIKSRIGLEAIANVIEESDKVINKLEDISGEILEIDAIIADEAQFFTESQILELRKIASCYNVPVFCFGLRTDFRGKLFPGSKALFELADSISEIKSICKCGNKAIINARFDSSGNVVTEGEQVDIGGNEKYEGMCWLCWNEKKNAKMEK